MLSTFNTHSINVDEANLDDVVKKSMSRPIMLYFWSEHSSYCAELGTILDKLSAEYAGAFTLAKVNCDEQLHIAQQFQLQAVPTVYILKEGQPVDGFQGPKNEENLRAILSCLLPHPEEAKAEKAAELIAEGKHTEALVLLKEAHQLSPKNKDITLLYAEILILLNKIHEAENVLTPVPLQEQSTHYHNLLAQIARQKHAADTPEIQKLQQVFTQTPNDTTLAIQLALKLHEVNRNKEALALLFTLLKSDVHANEGAVKKTFMDILSAEGTSDTLANQFRHQLYSLLY